MSVILLACWRYPIKLLISFISEQLSADKHIDFSYPFGDTLRQQLQLAANKEHIPFIATGTYAVTQGPRLEMAAEIQRLKTRRSRYGWHDSDA